MAKDWGKVDIVVHSLANGPEVQKPLLETSRRGYLAAMSASSYSFVSLLQVRCLRGGELAGRVCSWSAVQLRLHVPFHVRVSTLLPACPAPPLCLPQRFGPLMNPGGAAISLTYIAADRVIPGAQGEALRGCLRAACLPWL